MLLSLLTVKQLSTGVIKDINSLMFNPPKSETELESEVLSQVDKIYVNNIYDESLYLNETVQNIRYDQLTGQY
jgi:hypothetical protein